MKYLFLMGLLTFNIGLNIPMIAMEITEQKLSPPLKNERGWSSWNPWIYFPFDQIQVGISNLDLGAMLDFEYSCFGSVGDENKERIQESYWYRIADKTKKKGKDIYVQIEVGCWLNNTFKSKIMINGIK